jgi:hypothetical protein
LDVARVKFYAALLADPNSSLGGTGTTLSQEELHSGATTNCDHTFVLQGEVGPQTPGCLI